MAAVSGPQHGRYGNSPSPMSGGGTVQRTIAEDRGSAVDSNYSDQWDFSVPDPHQELHTQHAKQQAQPANDTRSAATTVPALQGNIHDNLTTQRSNGNKGQISPYLLSRRGDGTAMNAHGNTEETDDHPSLTNKNRKNGVRNTEQGSTDGAGDRSLGKRKKEPKLSSSTMENGGQDEGSENSRWIHRDKLLLIEQREMQEAGITLPDLRTGSGARSRREMQRQDQEYSNQETPEEQEIINSLESEGRPAKDSKKRRLKSPIPNEEMEEKSPLGYNFDPRTAEELEADDADAMNESESPMMYRQPTLRSSSSRIPLPKSSPMPISRDPKDRSNSQSQRRGANGSEDETMYHSRSRNVSAGSQNLLDESHSKSAPGQGVSTPTSSSRPVSRGSPTKTRSASNRSGKDNSASANSTSKGRSASSTTKPTSPSTPSIRPRSRSGLEPRPPTGNINRPEGEAPWIKEMYAPDPRLPPDKQMLPTHAKRLQQEQWDKARLESEARQRERAKRGEINLDKDLPVERDMEPTTAPNFSTPTPLAVHTHHGLQPANEVRYHSPAREDNSDTKWPLSSGAGSGTSPVSQSSAPAQRSPVSPLDGDYKGAGSPKTKPPNSIYSTNNPSTTAGAGSGSVGYSTMPHISPTHGHGRSHVAAGNKPDLFEQEQYGRKAKISATAEDEKQPDSQKKEKEAGCCTGCVVM